MRETVEMPLPAGPNEGNHWSVRVRWLGHSAFFICVIALVLNDHVLKDAFPGWWTGKLSDFAGVAVIGVISATLLGPRRGVVLAGFLFVALKSVPGVAEAAAPWLGGVTRRDQTDLIALAALLPVWLVVGRPRHANQDSSAASSTRARRSVKSLRTALATSLPLVGIIFAVGSTTATSCAPEASVVTVASDDDGLYALVASGTASEAWARSGDGGQSWQSSEMPDAVAPTSAPLDLYEDPGPIGVQEVCATDGTCWRLQQRRSIDRVAGDGTVVEELRLTDGEFADISTGCAGSSIGVLASIAVAEIDGDARVVASLGADGVLARQVDGSWERVRVLSSRPASVRQGLPAASAFLLFAPVLAVVVWLVGRRRSWPMGLAVAAIGWLATLMAAGAISLFAGPDTDTTRASGLIVLVGSVLTAIGSIAVARRPTPVRGLATYPPPRLPPPPFPAPPPPPPRRPPSE